MEEKSSMAASRESILAAIREIKAPQGISSTDKSRAPQYAHDMLDAMLSAKNSSDNVDETTLKGAPGWAHAVLDLIWDLL